MVTCAYCEKPLVCDKCRADYTPPSEEVYQALSQPDVLLACPECGAVLICHWCKTPYDGSVQDAADATEAPQA
ncbi:MAG TPA: hypothetical protein VFF52_06040 [Isosphaeraceae bacterium]|nr:hypothetical protein [Isosphaeraceae bacterium]